MLTEHPTDRLDPEPSPVTINEPGHHGKRGSSSRAKKLGAANKILLARFSSRFSRSNSLNRFASSLVVPGGFPALVSAAENEQHARRGRPITPQQPEGSPHTVYLGGVLQERADA